MLVATHSLAPSTEPGSLSEPFVLVATLSFLVVDDAGFSCVTETGCSFFSLELALVAAADDAELSSLATVTAVFSGT